MQILFYLSKVFSTLCSRRNNPKVHFDEKILEIEAVAFNKEYKLTNSQRVSFISNILGKNGYLTQNLNKNRVLLGRGRIKFNTHKKSSRSPGPSCKFSGEAKLNNIVYSWPAVCTVQLINTWRQAEQRDKRGAVL